MLINDRKQIYNNIQLGTNLIYSSVGFQTKKNLQHLVLMNDLYKLFSKKGNFEF